MQNASLRDDTRGLGLAIVGFAAILVVGILLFILFDPALETLFGMTSGQASTTEAQEQITLAQSVWAGIPFYLMALAAVMLIGRSVLESRRGV